MRYRGYGQAPEGMIPWEEWMETERPTAVDPSWRLYSRLITGRWRSYDDAAAAATAEFEAVATGWEAGVMAYPSGWDIHEFDDGTFGASITYWAPAPPVVPEPDARKPSSIVGPIVAVGAGVLLTSVIVIAVAKS